MKLLTCYTPSHKVFFDQFVLTNPPDGIELIVEMFPQECPSGEFAEEGWNATTARKFEFLIRHMNEMKEGEIFTFSDVDVQFFDTLTEYAHRACSKVDIAFQNDYYGHACTGFFFCRNTEQTRHFFEHALLIIKDHRDDQAAVNHILATHPIDFTYGLLPNQFFTFGSFYNHWNGETDFPVPDDIVMHHANWVKGIDKKLELLRVVRNIYNKKNGIV